MKIFAAILALAVSSFGQVITGSGPVSGGGSLVFQSQGVPVQPLSIVSPSCPLPDGTVGTPYSQTFVASGGTGPYTYAIVAGSIPDGTTISLAGVLSGNLTAAGTFSFSVQGTDATNARTPPYSCSVLINPIPAGPISITNGSTLQNGALTVPYSLQFTATGGTPGFTFATCGVGTLPNGLILDTTGLLHGTPTVNAVFSFHVIATDTLLATSPCTLFTITINTTPVCSTSPGPPSYLCSRTDLANAMPPVPIPDVGNLTGFNTIVTPAGYNGNRVVRVSDPTALTGTSVHNTSFWDTCGGSGEQNQFNSDSTLFIIQDEGCNTFPVAFNPSTMQASKIYAGLFPNGAYQFPVTAFWKHGSRNILHASNGVTIEDRDFTDWTTGPRTTPPVASTVIDFTAAVNGQHNCLTAGFVSLSTSVGSSSANDTIVMAYSSTSGQGTSGMVYLVAHVPGKGCAMWRTDTGAVTTDPGFVGGTGLTCNANGCTGTISTPDRFTIHNTRVGQSDAFAVVTGTICNTGTCVSGFPDGPYVWQIGTTNVGWIGQGGHVGGHSVVGYSDYFNNPGTNHIWQDAIRTLGVNTLSSSLVIPLNQFPTFPGSGVGITDAHYTWQNVDVADANPIFWSSYAHPSGTPANSWVQVTVPVAATKIRDGDINTRTGCIYIIDRLSGFFVSCDGGTTWNQRNTGLANTQGWDVAYDPVHKIVVIGIGTGVAIRFYKSADDGVTWVSIPIANAPVNAPSFKGPILSDNGSLIMGGFYGAANTCGTYYSTNIGTSTSTASCTITSGGTAPGGAYSLFHNPITHQEVMGTEQFGIFISTNNGQTWQECSPPDQNFPGGIRDGNVDSITYDNTGLILMATQGGVWKQSSTGACPWTFVNTKSNPNTSEGRGLGRDYAGNIYYGHKNDPNDLTNIIYQSTDGGVTWSPFATGFPAASGLEPWKFIQNPLDWQVYAFVQNGVGGNAGTIWKTAPSNGTLSPYGWQNEIMATTPDLSGKTWRFTPSFNTTLSQFFQTQTAIPAVSQDGKFLMFNSDWYGTLGSETGQVPCQLGKGSSNGAGEFGNCHSDVFIVELK